MNVLDENRWKETTYLFRACRQDSFPNRLRALLCVGTEMSQQKENANGSLGYQTKNNEEVDVIVERLNTPRKRYEPKPHVRQRKIERRMSEAEIEEMVQRLHSCKVHPRPKSAYEQGGVMLCYCNTGWARPGSGMKRY